VFKPLKLIALAVLSFSCIAIHAAELTAWVIDGEAERPYFIQLEKAFNKEYGAKGLTLKIKPIPGYGDAIPAAFMSRNLPDVLMIDGPNMANYVWSKMLRPIDQMVDPATVKALMPGVVAQGTYGPDKHIYLLGQGDSSVGLWGNKRFLERAGVEIPTSLDTAWDYEQFTAVLAKLKATPGVKWPLDLKLNYSGEWLTYGYYPFIKSAGGNIIDPRTWKAQGTINSPATVGAVKNIKRWIDKGYVVPATAGDNRFFGDKTVALAWAGNWMWRAHSQALGDNLVLIPAPRFGPRSYVPNGGWGWAVPAKAQRTDDIAKFLNFVLSKEQVAAWSNITGYIPARADAAELTKLYSKNGKARLFAVQAMEIAVVRPIHPAYPVISSAFGKALSSIFEGADAQKALDKAASTIDEDIEDNNGYPPFNK
jgi:multiple sugar transport system substrate-binding protein